MNKDAEEYRRLAAEQRVIADAADLINVRDRALRAEAAWLRLMSQAMLGEANRLRNQGLEKAGLAELLLEEMN